jgi:outer membrane lipoprotein LolB
MKQRGFAPVCALLIAAGLTGCAPFMGGAVAPRLPEAQQQLYRIKAWKLEGRIAVKSGNEGWNANLFWEHEDGQDRLRIYGPFSQGAVSIIVQSDLVYINEGNGVVSSSRDPDDLLKKRLGFTVPLRSMRYWVLGLPAPDTEYHAETDGKGGFKGFEQQSWMLDFTSFENVGQFVMPQKMTIRGNAVSLKLVVDEWVFKN